MTETAPRMYSQNLAAYVICTTDLLPEFHFDTESETVYMVFPICKAVSIAIGEFRKGNPIVKLHDFIHAVKLIRNSMEKVGESHGR